MTRIFAIDPGPDRSARLVLDDQGIPESFAKELNDDLIHIVRDLVISPLNIDVVVIEQIEPRYGLNVGWETLDTARLVGQLEEAAYPLPVARLRRSEVLAHLGVITRGANRTSADAGVRAALIDRFGGSKEAAVGRKSAPGPLHRVTADCWAALAVAVTWRDQQGGAS